MNTYTQAIDYINSFTKSGKPVKNLERITALLNLLGNPQDSIEFIHIAGTNGKGSASSMCYEILKSCGKAVGLFTSPYIIEFRDRIRLGGKNTAFGEDFIPQNELVKFTEILKNAVDNNPEFKDCSQFEITFAIALLFYKSQKTDVIVLETGLGGLLDCTNIIKKPLCELITSIGYDHTAVLGDTLEKIALQKAGIIKPSTTCFANAQNQECVYSTIKNYAESVNADIIIPDISKLKINDMQNFEYKDTEYNLRLFGKHMITNALTVIEAMKFLNIPEENIKEGLSKAFMPARQQILREKPLLMLDGSHNPDGITALKTTLESFDGKKTAVVGMLKDKDYRKSLDIIADSFEKIYFVDDFAPNCIDSRELANQTKNGIAFGKADMDKIKKLAENNQTIIFGSLYLASYILNNIN